MLYNYSYEMGLETLSTSELTNIATPRKRQWHQPVALLMMVFAIIAVYLPQGRALWVVPAAPAKNTYIYHTDLDFWTQTNRARTVASITPFDLDHNLEELPLQVGDWHGVEKQETNQEVIILLDPEQYVLRLYQNSKGQYIWLSVIGARSSQSFHPPDICYDADGWQWTMNSHATTLTNGGEMYGLYLEAEKQIEGQTTPVEHVVYYFYLFPNDKRNLSDGIVLFKLTSGRYGSLEETLAMQDDFVRQFFLNVQEQ